MFLPIKEGSGLVTSSPTKASSHCGTEYEVPEIVYVDPSN